MPIGPQELISELLGPQEQDAGTLSRMPVYKPELMIPRAAMPQDEGEAPPMHMSPMEQYQYGDQTPGGGSPYSRPTPGINIPKQGPGSEQENIQETTGDRQEEIEQLLEELIGRNDSGS